MNKYLKANSQIVQDEIEFEQEVMIEADGINAYISTANIDLNKKFNLRYEKDTYYDMYLNYNYLKNNIYIVIVHVSDESRKYYRYNPNREERKVLMDKLNKYIKEIYNQTIEEFIQESEKAYEEME